MYDEILCTGDDLRNVLDLFGKIDWGVTGVIIENNDGWKNPPVVLWRYKEKDKIRDQLIADAVNAFKGNIQWTISFRDRESLPGRNWWISPKQLEEFRAEIKKTPGVLTKMGVDLEEAFSQEHPEIGETANREISDLAEYIKEFVKKGLEGKILT